MNRYWRVGAFLAVSTLAGGRAEAQIAGRGGLSLGNDGRSVAWFAAVVPYADSARSTARDVVAAELRAMVGVAAPAAQSRHRAEIAGIAIGAVVGAVVGNKLAYDHRPGYSDTPGGYRLNRADHSTAYRISAIGVGAVTGAFVGGFVDR